MDCLEKKVYLDGKLQVTLAYDLYYKRNFSYCQTLTFKMLNHFY